MFSVEFPCTGKENAEVDITMGVNVTTAYYMSSLRLRRRKICLKNLVDPPAQPPVKKKSKDSSKAAGGKDSLTPRPALKTEGSYTKKATPKGSHGHGSPGKVLVDHVAPDGDDDDFYREESPDEDHRGSVMSIAAPAVPEISGKDRDQQQQELDGVTSPIDQIEEVGQGAGILEPPKPVFIIIMAAVGGTLIVIMILGGGYFFVRRRRNARG